MLRSKVVALIGMAFLSTPAYTAETVAIESGSLKGSTEAGVQVFRGVPYAAPPTGHNRWREPQPVSAWTGTRNATHFSPACPQVKKSPTQLSELDATSEDCLYLNIWAPTAATSQRYPVMVWIHGGGFIAGSGSDAHFDGRAFAERGVILVTINYRLGRLGFFAHPALKEQKTANFALLDQLAALRWVQRNISAFGGDPDNVTIFGESAGGISVMALTASPQGRGLFHKAIVQSGAFFRPLHHLSQDQPALSSAQSQGKTFAESLGISGDDAAAADALKALPIEQIAPTAPELPEVLRIMASSSPVLDDNLLPRTPLSAFRAGQSVPVPMMIGSNSHEAWLWQFGDQRDEISLLPLGDWPQQNPLASLGESRSTLAPLYRQAAGDSTHLAALVATDQLLSASTRLLARLASRNHNPVYLYRFDAVPTPLRAKTPGAPHGMELFYLFNTLDHFPVVGAEMQTEDHTLAETFIDYWTAFAKTGVPTAAGSPDWPAYDPKQDRLMLFGNNGAHIQATPRAQALDQLEQQF